MPRNGPIATEELSRTSSIGAPCASVGAKRGWAAGDLARTGPGAAGGG